MDLQGRNEELALNETGKTTRRQVLAATAAAPLALLMGGKDGRGANTPPPNILFLMADDFGYADLSCYGRRDYKTPNIDRLATEGIRLTQAYANSAVCTASRVALLTGRYQYRLAIGLEEPLGNRNVGVPPSHPTIPSLLRKAGYGTALFGKWHLGRLPDFGPLQSGYDHFWGFRGGNLDYFTHKTGGPDSDTDDLWDNDVKIHQNGYLTDLLAEQAIKSINGYAKEHKPFFISVHFNAPHWPWEGPDDEAASKTYTQQGGFDAGTIRTYAKMVGEMDLQIGRILKALDANGTARNTIVVFTSDNGGERFSDTWPFTGKKTELLEGGLRIPGLVRWPGHIRPKTTTDQVAMNMDWLPTLVAAASAETDPAYPPDGINLLPWLTQGSAPMARRVYWRYRLNAQQAVRDGDMKYLKINDNTFLFNVAEDPLERANLKNRKPDVYKRLADDYSEWEKTMLPIDPAAATYGFHPNQMADHYAPQPAPVPEGRGGRGAAGAGAAAGGGRGRGRGPE
jgi:arylsulfatase A-like enzyme